MGLETLLQRIIQALPDLAEIAEPRETPLSLGLRRSARLPVSVAIHAQLNATPSAQRPILLITDRVDHALTLAEELELWAPHTDETSAIPHLVFPEPTPLFYENAAWGDATRRERLLALTTLATYHVLNAELPPVPPLIITTARALMTRTIPRREFLGATRTLKIGQSVQVDELMRAWVSLGFQPVNTVIAPGEFARRGGILDLWPPAEATPVRIELFGDEIETLRHFDPTTQRIIKDSDNGSRGRILITPAREFLAHSKRGAVNVTPANARKLAEGENYTEFDIPLLHPTPASLIDYLPRASMVLVDDWQALADAVAEVEEQAVKTRQDAIKEGTLPEDFPLPYLTWEEIQDSLSRYAVLELGSSQFDTESVPEVLDAGAHPADEPQPIPGAHPNDSTQPGDTTQPPGTAQPAIIQALQAFAVRFSPGPRFAGRLKPVMEHLLACTRAGEALVIVSRQSARLAELWREQANNLQLAGKEPELIENSLSEGWIFQPLTGSKLHLLTDGELFGWQRPKPRQRRSVRYRIASDAPEAAYADMQVGDWLVHMDHGIGRFTGLVRRSVEGVEREYLSLEYADNAQLYVPIHQVDRLSRYVGPDNREPTPSRLGSTEWRSAKNLVKEAVRAVAEDLVELYARRSIIEGYQFGPDTPWQQELEASFPYIETEDQVQVIREVKQDMESNRPMDRLICGDVGYGKTEVALRAAFKAVNDGKQVAILVPTTVLAQQHYHTFSQRLMAFPVTVEMLSRFRTPQQQKDILERLKKGQVDIIVGTHRLLSSDVQFKDLGMVVIDEEQRFGVTHKEALKKMRTEVDVLTMTATPIPRTLYMALSGVRDISTINTPPEERLPIVTHVGPYSPKLVRQAIVRELERGGQIFFVHNRVQTIEAMRHHLESLAPEARIAVAHGQMAENELSQRMEQFTNGEVDILLCTSIIESGLDIPNANTLIVDRADTFGLAQLYQLRGRVGRGAQRAYAYFFRHNKKLPTFEGRQRLETIAENTQLGAGFSIAMRDLEIRGTGDILGTRQSGHIAAVGFHLYTRLLADAVQKLRAEKGLAGALPPKLPGAAILSASVELPLPVSFTSEYIPDKDIRLGLYRRIADLHSQAEVEALAEELQERFGPLPPTVQNLLYQLRVRLLAEKAGLASIHAEGGQLVMRYPDNLLPDQIEQVEGLAERHVRVGKTALWMLYKNQPDWQTDLVEALEALASLQPLRFPGRLEDNQET